MTDTARHRCAEWARDVDLDPAGTAPRCDVLVLVEHPLPWPSDLADDPLFAELEEVVATVAGNRSVRVQALVAGGDTAFRRVTVFAAGDGPFRGYGRMHGVGRLEEIPDLVRTLLGVEPPPPATSEVTHVLVCTHGGRDACCGSLGTRLWLDGRGLGDVEVWRTSHTGGHRFAPTAITFPDGNVWAHLDVETLAAIVDRSLPAAEAARHLRGCAAFPPAVQVADRAVLAERGWSWLDAARFGEERTERRIGLCYETPDGVRGDYDVCLAEGRRMPVPDCGNDPTTATKSAVELRVTRLVASGGRDDVAEQAELDPEVGGDLLHRGDVLAQEVASGVDDGRR